MFVAAVVKEAVLLAFIEVELRVDTEGLGFFVKGLDLGDREATIIGAEKGNDRRSVFGEVMCRADVLPVGGNGSVVPAFWAIVVDGVKEHECGRDRADT